MNLPYYLTWDKQNTDKTFSIHSYESCYFIKENGDKIIDLSSISYHCPLGGRPKPVLDKMREQMNRFCCASPKAQFELKNHVSMRLLNFLGFGSGKLFYTVSGAESVENALKFARTVSGKRKILARKNSYHGATSGALAITGDWRNQENLTSSEWTIRIPEPFEDPDLKKTEQIIKDSNPDEIAAFCLETVTGGNGVIIPSAQWYEGIQKLCDKYQILLILDEVIGGFYRTGKPFAFSHYNVKPDIVCMAKVISAGMIPFGAVWTNKKIASYFDENILPCGLTNYAHPLGLAALDGVLDVINDQDFIKSLNDLIKSFHENLKPFENHPKVKEVRKIGLLAAIELKAKPEFKKFLDKNLYVQCSGNNVVLAPSYIIDEKILESSLQTLKEVIDGD